MKRETCNKKKASVGKGYYVCVFLQENKRIENRKKEKR